MSMGLKRSSHSVKQEQRLAKPPTVRVERVEQVGGAKEAEKIEVSSASLVKWLIQRWCGLPQ